MVWGGSLNKEGSDYIRKLREADKVITFLESLKEELNTEEQANFSRTIEIIVEYISKISEKKE
ncbi:MAG: hypothetical protein CEE43_09825 [Promethearchaeota archaeon Loki_b32]|nr:MAG: hypothetical protein CEE43_09825 [Candidatus Lokiarchaeota archaeon Loki_b32]